jgi:hypothetical protein
MSDAEARRRLEELLLAVDGLEAQDLRGRLQWLEDAALTAEQLDLGEAGARGALDLKAALGAVVQFASSSMNDAALLRMEAVFQTLVVRGTTTLLQAIAADYHAIARVHGAPKRAEAEELGRAFDELADAVARGRKPPARTAERIEAVRRSLDGG